MSSSQKKKPTHYKTIFISDIHLGTHGLDQYAHIMTYIGIVLILTL